MNHRTLFAVLMFVSACGGDSAPQSPDESEEVDDDDGDDTSARDASTRKDAGRSDAGRKDAGRDSDDDGSDDDEGDDDTSARDAGRSDAGRTDAGTRDAGASDAGRTDAGSRDAGAGGGTGGCASLTYESFGKQFMTDYCVSCHAGQTTGPRLDSLQAIVAVKASTKNMVATMAMPPRRNANQPTAEERTKLGQWIDCGPK